MADEYFRVFVQGRPAPQGSKRYLGQRGGKGIMVESSKAVAPWRTDVRDGVLSHRGELPPMTGPLAVDLSFVLPRPKSTPKRSTPAATKRPDVDKLTRAVLDAIGSAGLWSDDSQVTRILATKRLALPGERSGCHITVCPSPDRRWVDEDQAAERTADALSGLEGR